MYAVIYVTYKFTLGPLLSLCGTFIIIFYSYTYTKYIFFRKGYASSLLHA